MRIDPLVVEIGAMLCLIPVLFGMLVSYWPRPSTRFDHNVSVTDMALDRVDTSYDLAAREAMLDGVEERFYRRGLMRDEGDLLAADPPHDNCGCASCVFWREWHRTMA